MQEINSLAPGRQSVNEMNRLKALTLLVACSEAGKGPNILPANVPDAFQVFAAFPYAVGIADVNNDTIFECLTAKRKDFDPVAKTVTYVWSLNDGNGKRKHVGFHHTAGATPDATNFTVGEDSNTVEVAYFLWSDNKDCAITIVPYYGEPIALANKTEGMVEEGVVINVKKTIQYALNYLNHLNRTVLHTKCKLWVSKRVENLVPVRCLEQFHDKCGVAVTLRDSDLCVDDEDDMENY